MTLERAGQKNSHSKKTTIFITLGRHIFGTFAKLCGSQALLYRTIADQMKLCLSFTAPVCVEMMRPGVLPYPCNLLVTIIVVVVVVLLLLKKTKHVTQFTLYLCLTFVRQAKRQVPNVI